MCKGSSQPPQADCSGPSVGGGGRRVFLGASPLAGGRGSGHRPKIRRKWPFVRCLRWLSALEVCPGICPPPAARGLPGLNREAFLGGLITQWWRCWTQPTHHDTLQGKFLQHRGRQRKFFDLRNGVPENMGRGWGKAVDTSQSTRRGWGGGG